jgi:hypothetical protein
VRGQGANLGLHLLPLGLRTPVMVQLQALSGACFESRYDASVRANGGQQFRANGD